MLEAGLNKDLIFKRLEGLQAVARITFCTTGQTMRITTRYGQEYMYVLRSNVWYTPDHIRYGSRISTMVEDILIIDRNIREAGASIEDAVACRNSAYPCLMKQTIEQNPCAYGDRAVGWSYGAHTQNYNHDSFNGNFVNRMAQNGVGHSVTPAWCNPCEGYDRCNTQVTDPCGGCGCGKPAGDCGCGK